ncbi:MAG TPA: hypothetical protein VGN63_22345 [Flavisolibacter sp.]|nr:hypothetical protein [Flavisolibacter sp.]
MNTERQNYKNYSLLKFLVILFAVFSYLMLKFLGYLDQWGW